MSREHVQAALLLEKVPPTPKTVLVHIAYPACELCGLSWAGVPWLERKTGLGRTAVKGGIDWLVKHGHVVPFGYLQGGRGRTTEYIVLPQLFTELSTPKCGKCAGNQERGRHATGIARQKGVATRPVLDKEVAERRVNGSADDPQSVIESESVTRSRVKPKAESSAPPRLEEPSEPPDPTPWAENAAQARRLADLFGDGHDPPSSRDETPDPQQHDG